MKRVFAPISLAALLVCVAFGGARAESPSGSDALMKAAEAVTKSADATAKAADATAKAADVTAKASTTTTPGKDAPQPGKAEFIPMDPGWTLLVIVVLNALFFLSIFLAYKRLKTEGKWSLSDALSEPLPWTDANAPLKAFRDLPFLQQAAVRANEDLFHAQAAANESRQAADAAAKAGAANASTLQAQAQTDADALKQTREQARKALDELAESTGTIQQAVNASKENMVSSSSRLIGFIAMLAMMVIYIGISDALIWSLLRTGAMPSLGEFPSFFVMGATLFVPYGLNQFRMLFTNK